MRGEWVTQLGDGKDGGFSGKVGYRPGLHFSSVSSPRTALPDRVYFVSIYHIIFDSCNIFYAIKTALLTLGKFSTREIFFW